MTKVCKNVDRDVSTGTDAIGITSTTGYTFLSVS